jgi:hypothetical protein
MTKSPPRRRRASAAPDIKALITATSLAVTIGGWAVFARSQAESADTAGQPVAVAIAPMRPSTDLQLEPRPLPTIVPPPQPPPKIAIDRPPPIPAALLSSRPAAVAQAAPPQAPAPAAPPPLPAASVPQLRVVSAPPQPVAKTRSSR